MSVCKIYEYLVSADEFWGLKYRNNLMAGNSEKSYFREKLVDDSWIEISLDGGGTL